MQDNRPEQPPARQAIWSIPGHLGRWYGGIFVFQYLVFLGLTIWDEVVYQTGNNTVQTILAVQRGMTANILNIAASAYVILEGVMLAHWLRERDKRKEQEAVEEAIKARQAANRAEEARAEAELAAGIAAELAVEQARQEERRQWQAWYERWQDAQREGRPFDEPPPAGPQDRNGKH